MTESATSRFQPSGWIVADLCRPGAFRRTLRKSATAETATADRKHAAAGQATSRAPKRVAMQRLVVTRTDRAVNACGKSGAFVLSCAMDLKAVLDLAGLADHWVRWADRPSEVFRRCSRGSMPTATTCSAVANSRSFRGLSTRDVRVARKDPRDQTE